MARRRRSISKDSSSGLLTETRTVVDRLLAELRSLRAENAKLAKEVERLSDGWEQVRRLARTAPRKRRV